MRLPRGTTTDRVCLQLILSVMWLDHLLFLSPRRRNTVGKLSFWLGNPVVPKPILVGDQIFQIKLTKQTLIKFVCFSQPKYYYKVHSLVVVSM